MWTTVYIATGIENAKEIQEILKNEGFLVKIKQLDGEEEEIYEILAPKSEVDDIEEVMMELGIL